MANFFVKPTDSFRITFPFDVSGDEAQPIFADDIAKYPTWLQAIEEKYLEYHFCEFKKPNWGLDCYLRELAYSGSTVKEREFSSQKLDEVRIRFLLKNSSFFTVDNPLSYSNNPEGYEELSSGSFNYIKTIEPFILRVFIVIADRIWDLGLPTNQLLSEDDYNLLRNDKDGLKKVQEKRGRRSLVNEADPSVKKKSVSEPEKLSTATSNQEQTAS